MATRMRRLIGRLTAAVGAGLLLAACSSGTAAPDDATASDQSSEDATTAPATPTPTTPTATPEPMPVRGNPLVVPASIDDVTLTADEPMLDRSEYRVLEQVPMSDGRDHVSVLDVAPDATLVLSQGERNLTTDEEPYQTTVRVQPGDGGEVERYPTPPGSGHSASADDAAVDDRHVVWMESWHTQGLFPWTLYVGDRATGEVRTLAEDAEDGINGYPPGLRPGLVLDGDTAVWSQSRSKWSASDRSDLMACDIDDCDPQTLLRGAAMSLSDGRRTLALQMPEYTGKPTDEARDAEIVSVDPQTGRARPVATVGLRDGETVIDMAASETAILLAINGDGPGRVVVLDRAAGLARSLAGARQGIVLTQPTATDDLVAWSSSGGGQWKGDQLLDLTSGEVVRVGETWRAQVADGAGELVLLREPGRSGGASRERWTLAEPSGS